jgi:hypothetical protein
VNSIFYSFNISEDIKTMKVWHVYGDNR